MSLDLSQLNTSQRLAVQTTDGPVLVLAGAGSGKTKTLVYRIAYLIQEKAVYPANILAVTFTNKASQEMRERVHKLLGSAAASPHISTFHSLCVRILREDIGVLGFDRRFSILDTDDARSVVRTIIKEKGFGENLEARAVLSAISRAKNTSQSLEELAATSDSLFADQVVEIFRIYQQRLATMQALDFDDLLLHTLKLLTEHPEVAHKWQTRFHYVLIDEYQDTNKIQYLLARKLSELHGNIFVVGDDWQSIYAFRGATVRNILEFERDFPGATIIKLEQNYRSTQTILDLAHAVIEKNTSQKKKKLWTDNGTGGKAIVYAALNERDEARYIGQQIQTAHRQGVPLSSIAILYRTNAQSRALEEAMLLLGIAYQIVGGTRFYERKEIKDTIAYLHLLANPAHTIALQRVLGVPARGIGKLSAEKIVAHGFAGLLAEPHRLETLGLKGKAKTAFMGLLRLYQDWRATTDQLTPAEIIKRVLVESGLKEFYTKDPTDADQLRWQNMQELVNAAAPFNAQHGMAGLSAFLEDVALVSDTDTATDSGAVTLMTLHAAKGLEFDTVFMAGMEDCLLPHTQAFESPKGMEEERRLCYVGMTRAKRQLYLCYAQERMVFGSFRSSMPSPFLSDLPAELLQHTQSSMLRGGGILSSLMADRSASFRDSTVQPDPETDEEVIDVGSDVALFQAGDRVAHDMFGLGVVLRADADMVSVHFAGVGVKQLMAKIAPLKKM